jgi:hypothetical protein
MSENESTVLNTLFNTDYTNLIIPDKRDMKIMSKQIETRVLARLDKELHLGLPNNFVVTTIVTNFIQIMFGDHVNTPVSLYSPFSFDDFFTGLDADIEKNLPVRIITGSKTKNIIKNAADYITAKVPYNINSDSAVELLMKNTRTKDKNLIRRIAKTSSYLSKACHIYMPDNDALIPTITSLYLEEILRYMVEEVYWDNNPYLIDRFIFNDNFTVIFKAERLEPGKYNMTVTYELQYRPIM